VSQNPMVLRVWQFINIFLSALAAGVLWGRWLSLSRSIASLTPQSFIEIGKTTIGDLVPVLPVLTFAAILSTITVLVLLYRRKRSKAFLATSVAFAAFMASLLITLLVEVPIDRQILEWTVTTLPTNWHELRDRRETFHVMRTFAYLAGLALILGAALFDGARQSHS
jgi:hypothetical protein